MRPCPFIGFHSSQVLYVTAVSTLSAGHSRPLRRVAPTRACLLILVRFATPCGGSRGSSPLLCTRACLLILVPFATPCGGSRGSSPLLGTGPGGSTRLIDGSADG